MDKGRSNNVLNQSLFVLAGFPVTKVTTGVEACSNLSPSPERHPNKDHLQLHLPKASK